MENFRSNQAKLREAFETSLGNNPLAKLAQRNLEMFKAAASAFVPGLTDSKPAAGESKDDEIAKLRAQMAAMQKKLDELGK